MSGKLSYKHTIFACYAGYITQAIVNNLSPLLFVIFRDTFDLPLSEITLLITINFLIQLCVDCLSAVFVDKIGYRKCIVAAHVFAVAGLASLAILPFIMPPFAGLLVSVFLYAVGGGLIEVLISPIVEACPTDNKASVMSLLHSFYCWGTVAVILLSTLFLTLAGRENWRILALLWAVFPLVNAVFFTKVPIAPLTEEGEGMKKIKSIFIRKKKGAVMENMLVMLVGLVFSCAFLVIIFGAFSGISDKWGMQQTAREYLLIMETEGYLSPMDQAALQEELEHYGLYNITFDGTTTSEVEYGSRIYLKISGTYDDNILAFAGAISKYTSHPSQISIQRQTTAKQ